MKGHSGTGEMKDDITQAVELTSTWLSTAVADVEALVPADVLAKCHGICFLNFIKAGFIFAGTLGTGFVLTKLDKGTKNEHWSAPSAITSGAFGVGIQVGAEMCHSVFTLNNETAKKSFYSDSKFKVGTDIGCAAGPVGRRMEKSGDINAMLAKPLYAYSYSNGVAIGASFEGAMMGANPEVNRSMYQKEITAEKILNGAEDKAFVKYSQLLELYQELNMAMALK
mmetsp:Transcript_7764/g.20338  ORF Transcript_7764/g.20338 Transcript_7764/m.20338 type:complete len:225 (+) Transcript_7764:131-805(+)